MSPLLPTSHLSLHFHLNQYICQTDPQVPLAHSHFRPFFLLIGPSSWNTHKPVFIGLVYFWPLRQLKYHSIIKNFS